MRYVLAIGLETEIYKNPRLEVFLNDRFLGMTDLDESVPAEMQQHTQHDIISSWKMKVKRPEKMHNVIMPKKWILYEIDDSVLNDENRLDIKFENLQTNNMNGFVTKMDKCKIVKIMFLPKEWFSADGVQKIFDHCDGRNVVIDTAKNDGWPSTSSTFYDPNSTPWESIEKPVVHEHPILNGDKYHQILYDKKLEIYMLEADSTLLPIHIKLADIPAKADELQLHPVHSVREIKFSAKQPQKLFENNSNTTLLHIDQMIKLYLTQIATKYQHDED